MPVTCWHFLHLLKMKFHNNPYILNNRPLHSEYIYPLLFLTSEVRYLPLKIIITSQNNIFHGRNDFLTGNIEISVGFSKNPVWIIFPIGEKYFLHKLSSDRRFSYRKLRFPIAFWNPMGNFFISYRNLKSYRRFF